MLFVSDEYSLNSIQELDSQLFNKYKDAIFIDSTLNRKLVSYQGNKEKPIYRWYKFKEAFSSELVNALFSEYGIENGNILDPFAGSGTALFTASNLGIYCDGIELLPLAQEIIDARINAEFLLKPEEIAFIQEWVTKKQWELGSANIPLPSLRITQNAYPLENQNQIANYLEQINDFSTNIKSLLFLALLCVVESISYTRKDGQYLRWDARAKRSYSQKRAFNKGRILNFSEAIQSKVLEILFDLANSSIPKQKSKMGLIRLFKGSNLQILPTLYSNSYNAIITSPPYCNRYDYTRTYALELALIGLDDSQVIKLRQDMLSSTVENRGKNLLRINPNWETALDIAETNELLNSILAYLDGLRITHRLNNSGIPRMVKGYFDEMSCVISECYRVLKPGSLLFMVNDNVRYAGVSIPVDLILTDFAVKQGFDVEKILVLQNGKGNSSQQMGLHGKTSLRKCVYIWRKP